ncbi:putative Fatty acid-binding protein, adipocyte [Hypsibius exemplaris]|uniref:Fatty acid-binding protein, adipocyte n=1 Tax=Hypsibius exemplaris TaxID=2072580 RepID=A0A1W0WFD7_HYPEX|nr:putative Fatty acid-binding protein, adipocyte [Hypsibius exemplaris]
MADQFIGNFELVSSDNFDKYMEAIGVGFLLRKVANSQKTAQVEITKNGDQYNIKTITSVKTIEVKFKLNEEFKEATLDGREVNTTFTVEGNVLRQTQRGIKDKDFVSTIDRQITPEGFDATIKYKDVTAVRKYKRN